MRVRGSLIYSVNGNRFHGYPIAQNVEKCEKFGVILSKRLSSYDNGGVLWERVPPVGKIGRGSLGRYQKEKKNS